MDEPITIFGGDYPTRDGTCVRDYVHVVDLARAHVLALDGLCQGSESAVLNLGAGRGCSNLEIVEAVSRVTGKKVPYVVGAKRRRPSRSGCFHPKGSGCSGLDSHAFVDCGNHGDCLALARKEEGMRATGRGIRHISQGVSDVVIIVKDLWSLAGNG